MRSPHPTESIDYLLVGHLTVDLADSGNTLGGTVAYAGATAAALGLRVGIVTSWGSELDLGPLGNIPISEFPSEKSTTFENIATPEGRVQMIHGVAPRLGYHHIPESWREASIVHLGPVAQDVETRLVARFPDSFIGVTPQGWLRDWDPKGHVYPCEWPEAPFVLSRAAVTIISQEDVGYETRRIEEMAAMSHLLVVTAAESGATVYWGGEERHFPAPEVQQVDATGSGDIFAAVFFTHYHYTGNVWEAANLATHLATLSVTRRGLASIPTPEEIQEQRAALAT